MFDSIAGDGLDNVSFQFLRPEVGERFGKCVAEAASKHHQELQ